MLTKVAWKLNLWTSRWIPDAFSIAVGLTLAVFASALIFTDKTFPDVILAWGNGFWSLLAFAMQMSLVMITGFIVSHSPYVKRGLEAFSRLASNGRMAVVLMAMSSMFLAWIHWGLGIVGSAVLARYFALRQPKTHYPLLVACGYFGLGALWHAGLSGSAPLLVATKGHFLEASLGVLPFSETIFTPWNIAMSLITLTALTALAWRLYPTKEADIVGVSQETLNQFEGELRPPKATTPSAAAPCLEKSYWINLILVFCGGLYILLLIARNKWNFDLNLFNFIFFIAAIGLHPNIKSFLRAAEEGAHSVMGIILQFPLYAGMYGVIKDTGLSAMLAQFFIRFANQKTFPLIVYWYSGILNYFVPSGGSKWAIEAPYLIEAARSLGVPSQKLVLAYAWGDMVTDLIQPFWCLPLLAAAKIEFRQIMGYLAVAFLAAACVGTVGILLL